MLLGLDVLQGAGRVLSLTKTSEDNEGGTRKEQSGGCLMAYQVVA